MHNILNFLACFGVSFLVAECAKWIVKEHYIKAPLTKDAALGIRFLTKLLVAVLLSLVATTYTTPSLYAYLIYATLVAITIFTDLYAMLIAPIFTLYCAPLGWLVAGTGIIPLTLTESLLATLVALIVGRGLYYLFFKLMKQEALGLGDLDFLIFVAAWTGFQGFWLTLSVGSYLATIYGIGYWFQYRTKNIKLPFGTFLGIASLISLVLNSDQFSLIRATFISMTS